MHVYGRMTMGTVIYRIIIFEEGFKARRRQRNDYSEMIQTAKNQHWAA